MASDLHLFYPYFFILKKNSNYGSEGGLFSDGLRPAARGRSDNGGRFRCPAASSGTGIPPSLPSTIHHRETREQEQEQASKVMACIGHTTKTRKSKQSEGRGCTGQKIATIV